jgi:hypothetical protein
VGLPGGVGVGLEDVDDILDHGVGEHVFGELAHFVEEGGIHRAIDGELETLADAHGREVPLAETSEGTGDGLALGVEKFSLGHDLDDDCGHDELPLVCRWVGWFQSTGARIPA